MIDKVHIIFLTLKNGLCEKIIDYFFQVLPVGQLVVERSVLCACFPSRYRGRPTTGVPKIMTIITGSGALPRRTPKGYTLAGRASGDTATRHAGPPTKVSNRYANVTDKPCQCEQFPVKMNSQLLVPGSQDKNGNNEKWVDL